LNALKTPRVVAEIGCNHKGDMDIARELIETAARFCKADFVKFQKRCNRELLTPEEFSSPHPNPANSYGATYAPSTASVIPPRCGTSPRPRK
jgi:N-acetylneuraminate synthase